MELENTVSEEDTMAATYDKIMEAENQDSPTDDAPEEEASETVEESPTGPEEVDTQEEPVEAPASWTAEAKEQFAQLPKETQKYISEREAQREKAINSSMAKLAETEKAYSGIQAVTQKHGQYLQQIGMSADVAFDTLLTAEYTLRNGTPEQKAQLFQQLAQDYGVPIQGNPDNQVSRLYQEVNTLKSTISSLTQSQQEAALQENIKTINAFAEAKDDKGSPIHPHFEDVREAMSKLMLSGFADTMDEAYSKAVLLVPEVKAKIDAENKRKADIANAEKAKKAKTQASTKSGGVPREMVGKSESLDDTMERIYDEINGA